jgi:hypothetical protein
LKVLNKFGLKSLENITPTAGARQDLNLPLLHLIV